MDATRTQLEAAAQRFHYQRGFADAMATVQRNDFFNAAAIIVASFVIFAVLGYLFFIRRPQRPVSRWVGREVAQSWPQGSVVLIRRKVLVEGGVNHFLDDDWHPKAVEVNWEKYNPEYLLISTRSEYDKALD